MTLMALGERIRSLEDMADDNADGREEAARREVVKVWVAEEKEEVGDGRMVPAAKEAMVLDVLLFAMWPGSKESVARRVSGERWSSAFAGKGDKRRERAYGLEPRLPERLKSVGGAFGTTETVAAKNFGQGTVQLAMTQDHARGEGKKD